MIIERMGWGNVFRALMIGAITGLVIGIPLGRWIYGHFDQSIATVTAHEVGGRTIAFSPDGKFVASADNEFIRVWSVDRSTKDVFKLHLEFMPNNNDQTDFYHVGLIGFSNDGQFLVSTSADPEWRSKLNFSALRAWRADNGDTYPVTQDLIDSTRFAGAVSSKVSSDGKYWISYEIKHGRPDLHYVSGITGHPRKLGYGGWLSSAEFAKEARLIALAYHSGEIRVWTPEGERRPKVMSAIGIVTYLRERWARFINGTGLSTRYYTSITDLAFTPDTRYLLSSGTDGAVTIFDYRKGKIIDRLTGHSDAILSMAVSADGKMLVTASKDMTLKLWDLSHFY